MKYALLIDSENAEPRMDEIFQELTKYGDTPIRYLLGNFTQSSPTHPWIKICQKHAITCVQTMNFTKGKNSLDISLVIEGMKVLYEKTFIDGVIIIASDSDYTPLAREWRNAGKDVIGIGRKLTPESYRASCTKFIYVENIFNKKEEVAEEEDNDLASIEKLEEVIESVLNENNGMAQLSVIVESIRKAYTDFDVRNYGFQKARDFFAASFSNIKLTEEKKNSFFISFKDKEEKAPVIMPIKEKPKKAEKAKKEKKDKNKKKKELISESIAPTWVTVEERVKEDEPKQDTVEIIKSSWTPEEELPKVEAKKEEIPSLKEEPIKEEAPVAEGNPLEEVSSKPKLSHEEVLSKTLELFNTQKKAVTFSKMNLLCKKNHLDFHDLGYQRFKDMLKDCGFVVEGSIVKLANAPTQVAEKETPKEEEIKKEDTELFIEQDEIVEEKPIEEATKETTIKPKLSHDEVLSKTLELFNAQKKPVTFSKMNLLCKKNHLYFRELGYQRFKDMLKDCGFVVEGSIVKLANAPIQEAALEIEQDLPKEDAPVVIVEELPLEDE